MQFVRESIFISALRSFCSSFMTVLGAVIAIILLLFTLSSSFSDSLLPDTSKLTVLPDAQGTRKIQPLTAPTLVCLKINGIIGVGDLTGDKVRNLLLDTREGMLGHDRVKGILLYIDSPGGAVTDSDDIYRALKAYSTQYNVPIYAYVDGLCASGGMYIAAASQKIMASPVSVIGSVGVRMGPNFNFSGLMERYGVQSMTMTEGIDKDMLNPFRPWKEGEGESLREIMKAEYARFVDIVTLSRPMLDKQKLVNIYGAQVYTAKTAQEYGYIDDSNASYNDAIAALAKAAGIAEDAPYQVFEISTQHRLFDGLSTDMLFDKVGTWFGLPANGVSPKFQNKVLYLYQP